MAITHIATVSATPGAAGGTTAAIDTTGANLLVISLSTYTASGDPVVSDSKGNTYIGLTNNSNGSSRHRLFYCLTPTVGTGHTFTASAAGSYPAIIVFAFAGVGSYQTESWAAAASATSLASGTVTPAANGALIITGNCGQTAVTDSVTPAGFTLTTKPFTGGVNMQGSAAWQVQATAAAINPTWGFSPSQGNCAVGTAVFLPSAASAGTSAALSQLVAETLTPLPPAPARLTQLIVETLSPVAPPAAATVCLSQLVAELLTPSPPPTAILTQLAVEVATPSPPTEARYSQLALEVYRAGTWTARLSQLAVEIYHPVLVNARVSQAVVEWLQARPARTRVSSAVVELWTVPAGGVPPPGQLPGGSCPTPFFDPDSDEDWP